MSRFVLPWAAVAVLVLALSSGCQKSGYAHCVSVADEKAYTGQWLRNRQAVVDSVMKTEQCAALEASAGESDGPKLGKVRWAECLAGPDCDEAGKF